ncbi:sigma-70 family RNA polymerase sigma factor [Luteimonas sp. XNQY3]|nr:sigma-70 family RNA polymerase sigma factor [Luteimonas sp. XNQY3]MCD9006335.1 sigma-70 family RNA polymerase sigma factor [Luteimonas sp. XNQY3]
MTDAAHERFSVFFAETRQGLLRYVRRLTRSREAAEDIVQETYARTLARGDQVVASQSYLFVTARHLAWNSSRHHRTAATETVGDVDELAGIEADGVSPEEALIAEEASLLLRQAIERLPEQCRAAFALKVFHACSYKDIADQLGISTKTVEKHIARGLRETHAYLRRRYQLPAKAADQPHD